MTLGEKINKLRLEKKLSYGKLAELTGISKTYLHGIEKGVYTSVGNEYIQKLAVVFGCTSDYLIGITDEPGLIYVTSDKLPTPLADYIDGITILKEAYEKGLTDQDIKELIELGLKFKNKKS